MLTWNPHRLVITKRLQQKLVQDTGDGTILSLSDLGQSLIEIARNFNPLAIFA
jgi:hypothetical protein